jgi:hypothetical protein
MKLLNTTTAKFFGETVDLNKLNDYPDPEVQGGTFEGWAFVDMTNEVTQKKLTQQDENTDARANGNDYGHINRLGTSFSVDGFHYDKFASDPIILDLETFEIDNGRSRTKASQINHERVLPVALFSYKAKTAKTRKIVGLKKNKHLPALRVTRNDVTQAVVDLIVNRKELDCTIHAIERFLEDELEVHTFMRPGDVTIIINEAYEIASTGQLNLMILKERGDWINFFSHQGINADNYVLCQVDRTWNVSNVWRLDILPRFAKGTGKAKLILFTKEKIPNTARDSMDRFKEDLETLYQQTYALVNAEVKESSQAKIEIGPKSLPNRPWEIVGCAPQIVGKHDGQILVPLDKY